MINQKSQEVFITKGLNDEIHYERLFKCIEKYSGSGIRANIVLKQWISQTTYKYINLYENAFDIRNISDLLNCNMLNIYVWLETDKDLALSDNGYWFEVSNPDFELTVKAVVEKKTNQKEDTE